MRRKHDSQYNLDDFHRYCPCATEIEGAVYLLKDEIKWSFNGCRLIENGVVTYTATYDVIGEPDYTLYVTAIQEDRNTWAITYHKSVPKGLKSDG